MVKIQAFFKKNTFFKNILIFIGFFIWSLLPASLFGLLFQSAPQLSFPLQLLTAFVWLGFVIFTIVFFMKYYQKISNDPLPKFTLRSVGLVVGVFFALRIIVIIATLVMQAVSGESMSVNDQVIHQIIQELGQSIFSILFYASIAIIAPIIEELVFRGLFSHLLFPTKPHSWLNGFVSSLLFAAMHMSSNLISLFMYFALGLGMFFVYRYRGTIKDSILLHMLNNGLAAIALFIMYNLPDLLS